MSLSAVPGTEAPRIRGAEWLSVTCRTLWGPPRQQCSLTASSVLGAVWALGTTGQIHTQRPVMKRTRNVPALQDLRGTQRLRAVPFTEAVTHSVSKTLSSLNCKGTVTPACPRPWGL